MAGKPAPAFPTYEAALLGFHAAALEAAHWDNEVYRPQDLDGNARARRKASVARKALREAYCRLNAARPKE